MNESTTHIDDDKVYQQRQPGSHGPEAEGTEGV